MNQFGNTDIMISSVGLGTWVMGGSWWGGSDREDCKRTIIAALESGINLVDTAPAYGQGISESIVGEALKDYGRDKMILSTKFGLRWDEKGDVTRNNAPDSIEYEVEQSLKRLQTDYIDIYHLHWPDFSTSMGDAMRKMEQLRKAGKIRAIAVSNLSIAQMEECIKTGLLNGCQPPLNMFERESEKELLPLCRKNNVGVLSYGAICRGLLSGKVRRDSKFPESDMRSFDPKFQPENLGQYIDAVETLEPIARELDVTLSQFAVAWAFHQPGVTCALVGARRPDQIVETAKACDVKLSAKTLQQVEDVLKKCIKRDIGPEFMAP